MSIILFSPLKKNDEIKKISPVINRKLYGLALNFTVCQNLIAGNVRALCRCGIRIPSARNRCPAFAKDKCLEPMIGDAGQARTNAAMLLMPIDTTSSRTCTKPTVVRCFSSGSSVK